MASPTLIDESIDEAVLSRDRRTIEEWQEEQLRQALDVARRRIPFYTYLFADRGRTVDDASDDLSDWPTWNVAELRAAMDRVPPFGDLYTEEGLSSITSIHSSSGTTGKPRYAPFTTYDEPRLTSMYRRAGAMLGNVGPGDRFCITGAFGLTIGSWSYTRMCQAVGATVVPAGSGRITPSDKLINTIHELGVTVVHGAASYLRHLATLANDTSRGFAGSKVRMLWVGGEGASPSQRRELETLWGVPSGTFYANSDLGWIAAECAESTAAAGALGMHAFEDTVLVEVLDENGQPCPDGESGELVITSWLRPSSPRIRFRTGDRAAVDRSACACGRRSTRILPIEGRTDDSIRFHGITIWPQAVEAVMEEVTGRRNEYFLECRRNPTQRADVLELTVENRDGTDAALEERLATRLRDKLTVSFTVRTVPPGATAEQTGLGGRKAKVRRVIDSRSA